MGNGMTLVKAVELAVGEGLQVLGAVGIGKLLKNIVNLGISALNLSINNCIGVIENGN